MTAELERSRFAQETLGIDLRKIIFSLIANWPSREFDKGSSEPFRILYKPRYPSVLLQISRIHPDLLPEVRYLVSRNSGLHPYSNDRLADLPPSHLRSWLVASLFPTKAVLAD